MTNRLKAYVRRTMLQSARDYAGGKRRTADSTRSACIDAMRGTDTGWWSDLIYTAPMLAMAKRYATDIATALAEYRDATGEAFVYRPRYSGDGPDISEGQILAALLARKPYTLAEYHEEGRRGDMAANALTGLRFAVEWYAGEVARDICPDL